MRILLLDCNPQLASQLEAMLQGVGHLVDSRESLHEIVRLAIGKGYDLIVLPTTGPDCGLVESPTYLRKKNIQVPIFIVCESASVSACVTAFNAGADGFLAKPFTNAECIAKIEALVRRSVLSETSYCLRAYDIVMHLLKRQVSCGLSRLNLTDKEFAVLELLIRRQGTIVTKREIYQTIWISDIEPQTNVVDVLVCRVRTKIERVSPSRIIRNVRGMGYTIDLDRNN